MPQRALILHEEGPDVPLTGTGKSMLTLPAELVVYVRSLSYAALRRVLQTLQFPC